MMRRSRAAELVCAGETRQLVLVEHAGGSSAVLSLHEKTDGIWREIMNCPAHIGKNGMGKRCEGDYKTPVGTFDLTTPFGILPDPGANMPYTQVTEHHYWCGESGSEYYNRFMDERSAPRRHTPDDEYLIGYGAAYHYCMFIGYNTAGEAGKGCCIFLHCFGEKPYTAGCVAVAEDVMAKILRWAEPGVKIVIE